MIYSSISQTAKFYGSTPTNSRSVCVQKKMETFFKRIEVDAEKQRKEAEEKRHHEEEERKREAAAKKKGQKGSK